MPKKDGKETLEHIKNHPDLKHIPVIILSGSQAQNDVLECYKLHANGYLLKAKTIDDHERIRNAVSNFWFDLAILPIQKSA